MKINKIFFVDCENVGMNFIPPHSDNNDILTYYFTSNFSYFKNTLKPGQKNIHIFHENEKDALDFVIDTQIGFAVRQYGKNVKYYIVSKDSGFEIIAKYWGQQGYKIYIHQANPNTLTKDEKLIMKRKYDTIVDQKLSTKDKKKLMNIYNSWLNSNNQNNNILKDNIKRSKIVTMLSITEIETICDYLSIR